MRWLEPQIETRAKLDAEMLERAYSELAASVVAPSRAPSFAIDESEQVDGAVKAALKYCGAQAGDVPEGIDSVEARLDYLCRPSGTMYRSVRLEGDWYNRAIGAMVGRFETGETVALLPRGLHGYYYYEPVTGVKKRITAQTAATIQPEATLFYRPFPAKELGVRDLMWFILGVFDRADYALVLFAALAATLVGLLPAWANNIAFGLVVPSGQASLIAPVAALLVGVAFSTALIGIFRNLIMARVALKIEVAAEAATFARVLSLPTSFFRRYASGNLAVRISQVTMLTQQLTSLVLGSGLTTVLSLVYVFQIAVYTPVLAVPALLVVIAQAIATVAATLLTMRFDRIAMNANAQVSGVVTALLNGIQKIKIAGAEDRAFAKWARGYSDYARASYNVPPVVQALPAIVTLIGLLGNVAIYYFAGSAHVPLANFMSFNVAFGQVTGAIMALAGMAGQIARITPMVEMVAPIFEEVPETTEGKPSVSVVSGSIDVSKVSFRYSSETPYVLDDLSFTVRPGEYVALVGKSGCGKSTIMRLLLGFEKPERGSIFFGPHDVSKIDLRSLRQNIGVVTQDGKLFMGDIASNITISTPTATLDDAWAAAEIAGIADDIRKMPMGMQTLVTEGSGGVSGGQRQRLMIARAVCSKPRILMLDEATSALDNKTQKIVTDSLDQLKCTRIVVAHRLSTVRHCDRILVVDNGRIAEEGTYDELIERGGLFAELVERQRLDA